MWWEDLDRPLPSSVGTSNGDKRVTKLLRLRTAGPSFSTVASEGAATTVAAEVDDAAGEFDDGVTLTACDGDSAFCEPSPDVGRKR